MFEVDYDAKFCLYYHFRSSVCGIDENIGIEINMYPQQQGQFFENFFNFTDTYLLFSKIEVKSLSSQDKIYVFELSTEFLGPKNSGKHQNLVFYSKKKSN